MPRDRSYGPSGFFRILVALVMAFSLSGLLHGAEEVIESAVHVADTGHGAHAGDHPEGEADPGQEHFCFGAVHTCGCCQTAVAAQIGALVLSFHATERLDPRLAYDDATLDGILWRIDRPPRA